MRFSLRKDRGRSSTDCEGRKRSGSHSSSSTFNTVTGSDPLPLSPAAAVAIRARSRDRNLPLPPDTALSSSSSSRSISSSQSRASTARQSSISVNSDLAARAPPLPKSSMSTTFTRRDSSLDLRSAEKEALPALPPCSDPTSVPREAAATPEGMRMEVVDSDGEDVSAAAFRSRTKRSSALPSPRHSVSQYEESISSRNKPFRMGKLSAARPGTSDSTATNESTMSTWGTLRSKTSAKLLSLRSDSSASRSDLSDLSESKAIAKAYSQQSAASSTKALPATPQQADRGAEVIGSSPEVARTKSSRKLKLQRPKTSECFLGQVPRFGSPRVTEALQSARKADVPPSPAPQPFDGNVSKAVIAAKLGPSPGGLPDEDFDARVELVLQWLAEPAAFDTTPGSFSSRRHLFAFLHARQVPSTNKEADLPSVSHDDLEIEILSLEKHMESYTGDLICAGRHQKETIDRLGLPSVFQEVRRRCGIASERTSFDIFCQYTEEASRGHLPSPVMPAPASSSRPDVVERSTVESGHQHVASLDMMRQASGGIGSKSLTPAPRRKRRPTTAPSRSPDTPPKPFVDNRSKPTTNSASPSRKASDASIATPAVGTPRGRSHSVLPPSAFARVVMPSTETNADSSNFGGNSLSYASEKRGSFSSFRSQGTCSTSVSMASASTGPPSTAQSTTSVTSGLNSPHAPLTPFAQQYRFGGLPSPGITVVSTSHCLDPKSSELDHFFESITPRELRQQISHIRLDNLS